MVATTNTSTSVTLSSLIFKANSQLKVRQMKELPLIIFLIDKETHTELTPQQTSFNVSLAKIGSHGPF